MTIGIVDTTVFIHLFRKNANAQAWLAEQGIQLSVTTISWLEVMYGSPGKSGQSACKTLLAQFELLYLTSSDQEWAMDQMLEYRLSRGVEINDCLIASIAHRLQVPLYTHNTKDMLKILPQRLVIQPYIP